MPQIELFVPEYVRPLLEAFRLPREKPYESVLIEEIDQGRRPHEGGNHEALVQGPKA